MTMQTIGTVLTGTVTNLAARDTNRARTLAHINARMVELDARKTFHQDPTPENLSAWVDANDAVEAAR